MFVRWVACWLCADEQSSQAAGLRRGSRPTRKLLARKAAHIREEGRTIHSRGDVLPGAFPNAMEDGDLLSGRLRCARVRTALGAGNACGVARTELKHQNA